MLASSESSVESVDSEDNYTDQDGKPPARKRTRFSPTRRASRGIARPSYEDPSSSEFSEEEEDVSSPDESREKRRSVAASSRRTTNRASSRMPPKKKAKGTKKRPVAKAWPDIALKHITKVGEEILVRLGSMDEDQVFAVPVVEAMPHLEDDYLATIEVPMDFRTIYEEGLPRYRSIGDLQHDLITVFWNCIVYNGEASEYGDLAQ